MKSKSKKSLNILVIQESRLLILIRCIEKSSTNTVFKDVFESLTHDSSWKEFNCHVDIRLFSHRRKLFILRVDETGHRIKKCHGQHHQGLHLQVIDQIYWYIIRSRCKERDFYPHRLFFQWKFCGPKAFKWRGMIQEDPLILLHKCLKFRHQYSWVSFSIDSVGYDQVVQVMFIGFHGVQRRWFSTWLSNWFHQYFPRVWSMTHVLSFDFVGLMCRH